MRLPDCSERFVRVLLDLEATSLRHPLPRIAGLLLEGAHGGCIENLTHQEIALHLRDYRDRY
jgi:hypothetical protein